MAESDTTEVASLDVYGITLDFEPQVGMTVCSSGDCTWVCWDDTVKLAGWLAAQVPIELPSGWRPPYLDQPLPEDGEIAAAHPMRSGRDDLYAEAMRLVGARHSKAGLVELVTWLLLKAENRN